jgi:hypothetical protein
MIQFDPTRCNAWGPAIVGNGVTTLFCSLEDGHEGMHQSVVQWGNVKSLPASPHIADD